ncbi:hypothetical protein F7734_39775 [Scytonema sp. UIC 10036]|uniref:hypothetical protein n=1 Tax=Scytonema sp. UIC 10036 TaxID=2304196 RepID=UPI0012DADBCD|nr:hypothetical protein [Scytonema sp. UIC 10036]MUG98124.1 hypothetical protein [Scytonema sp. UIC 10036]
MNIKSLALAILLIGLCFTGFTSPVYADNNDIPIIPIRGCTLNTLKSGYGVQVTGTFISLPSFPPGPFGQTGLFSFDGLGKMSGNDTVSLNGNIVSRQLSGTYTVNLNCEVSLKISDKNGNSATLKGAIVNKGQKILFIQAEPDKVVITGVAEKI